MISADQTCQAERQLEAFRILFHKRLDHPPLETDVQRVIAELSIAELNLSAKEVMERSETLHDALCVVSITVAGGVSAKKLFPDCVAVKTASGSFECSGVMISDEYLLTASHCLTVSEVAFGDTLKSGTGFVAPSVSASVVATSSIYDASIVKLAAPSPFSSDPNRGLVTSGCTLARGDEVVVVGFGCRNRKSLIGAGVKRFGPLRIVHVINIDPCRSGAYITAESVGASIGVCKGDSGGPLFIKDSAGRWLLVGISQSMTASTTSSSISASSFIRIDSSFADWVKAQSGVTLTPVCP